jgi:hypothetical protein
MKSLLTATTLACVLSATMAQTWWKPTAGTTWNIELSKVPTSSQANDQAYEVWDFDLFDSGASTVKTFKDKGHKGKSPGFGQFQGPSVEQLTSQH